MHIKSYRIYQKKKAAGINEDFKKVIEYDINKLKNVFL